MQQHQQQPLQLQPQQQFAQQQPSYNGAYTQQPQQPQAFGLHGAGSYAQQQPPMQSQFGAPLSSPAAPAPASAAAAGSITQLVQALQSGSISKQQLYSSLTNMYKGEPAGAPPTGGAQQPFASSSASFATPASAPFTPHQQQMQQATPQHQQQQQPFAAFQQAPQQFQQPMPQQQQQQQPTPTQPFQAFALPSTASPAPGGGQAYTAAEAAAAQQHIQNFLSRHLAGGQTASSLPPSAAHTPQQPSYGNQGFGATPASAYANGAPQHYHQQGQQEEEYDEAEEYVDSTRGSVHGGGGGGGGFYGASSASSASAAPHSQHRSRSVARSSVRERMAAVYTDEKNAELTFKPQITPLPRHIYKSRNGSGDAASDARSETQAPFLGRVMHWSESKRARERQRAVELEKASLAACTFKPTLNDESVAIVEAPGAEQRRLFSARSTARAKILEMEVRRAEEERFRAECTFEPALNRKSLAMAGNVAVRRPASASMSSSGKKGSEEAALAACTFAPKVNPVKPTMRAAQMYLEQNAFERLSSAGGGKARSARGDGSESEGGYESEGGGGARRGRSLSRSNGSASARARSQGARSVSPGSRGGASAAAAAADKDPGASSASFADFLARLRFKELQRLEKLEKLKADEQGLHQHGRPMLSKKSAQIVRESIEAGTYASPSKRSSSRDGRRHSLSSSASAPSLDAECTFAPSINPYSAALSRPRSFEAMSALEMARRAQNLERATQERLANEMAQASFTPYVNPKPRHLEHVESRLRVTQQPEAYVERVAFQQALREAERAREQARRVEEDLAQCTFAPQVHDAPQFVKRIARVVAQQKAQQQQQTARRSKPKPDWK